jgi:hypothetical protein
MSHIDDLAITLCAAVAEEIRDVRALIESVADILASDEYLAINYCEQLQSFDLMIQRAQEAADLLERVANGTRSLEAVEQVRLGLVQDRLRAALTAA